MSYSKYNQFRAELDGKVLRITLNKPEKRNIMNDDVNIQMTDIFVEASFDRAVHAIVLTGEGKVFCGGGDFAQMKRKVEDPDIYFRGMFISRRLVFSVLDCPKPTIAKLNGDAIGLGATLALLCDIVIAHNDAKILDPHVNVGLVAGDGGSILWPQLIGFARAKRYLLGGEPITGKVAEQIGLVAYSGTTEEIDALTEKWADKFANSALQSVMGTKITMNAPLRQAAQILMDIGIAYEGLSNITADHREAVNAFMEKRKPTFKGE